MTRLLNNGELVDLGDLWTGKVGGGRKILPFFPKCYLAGWTPLHVAAEGGREAVVEVLLHHKADCSLVTDTGLDACGDIFGDHCDLCDLILNWHCLKSKCHCVQL